VGTWMCTTCQWVEKKARVVGPDDITIGDVDPPECATCHWMWEIVMSVDPETNFWNSRIGVTRGWESLHRELPGTEDPKTEVSKSQNHYLGG
jgi:hypothetical protein